MNPENRMFLRYIILGPIFLMIARGSHGQTILNGKYSSLGAGQEHYEFYEFGKNKTFRFHSGASLGNDFYGNGVYHVIGDTIVLEYTTSPKLQAYHTSELYTNDKDSVVLTFKLFNLKKEKISGVNVIWQEGKKDYQGIILDDSKREIVLKKKADSIQVVLSYSGYQPYQISVDRRYNYEFKVYLQDQGVGLQIKKQIEKFLIQRDEDDIIFFEDSGGRKWSKKVE